MSTITFDTLKFSERLEQAGISREQAKAEADALREVLESVTQELATKADLREMKTELMGEMRLNRWMLGAVIGLAIANFGKQFF